VGPFGRLEPHKSQPYRTEIERYFDAVVARTCLNEAVGCVLVHLIHIKNAQQSLTQWVY